MDSWDSSSQGPGVSIQPSRTTDEALSELEDQVAAAASEMQQVESEVAQAPGRAAPHSKPGTNPDQVFQDLQGSMTHLPSLPLPLRTREGPAGWSAALDPVLSPHGIRAISGRVQGHPGSQAMAIGRNRGGEQMH